MRKYELLTVIKPNLDADEADKIIAKIEELLQGLGGSVFDLEKASRKKLAYDIDNFRDGFVVVQKLQLAPDKVKEFKRLLKLNENIIRTMFVELPAVKA